MGLVRTYYNPYRKRVKKASDGMTISSDSQINENPEDEYPTKYRDFKQMWAESEAGKAGVDTPDRKAFKQMRKSGAAGDPSLGPKGRPVAEGELLGGMGKASGAGVSGGVGAVAAIGTMGIEAFEDPDKQGAKKKGRMDTAKGALSGAAKGAAAGAVFGPWGAAAGAIIGGTFGAIKARKEHRKMIKELKTDRVQADQDARLASSKDAQQASNQYLAGLNAQRPTNPYTQPGIKSMKAGGVVAELTGGEYIIPEGWDNAIQKATEQGDEKLASNIYKMAPKQKTGGKFSHKENPIYVYADGDTEDKDGNSDVYAPGGSGVYNPKQHKKMNTGETEEVLIEQKTKGNR